MKPVKRSRNVGPSDEEILRQSLSEPERFEELVTRYEAKVYATMRRLCAHEQTAQDLFQTAWTQAFAGRVSFRGQSKFSTWLYQISVNVVRDHWRRQGARSKRESLADDELPEALDLKPGPLDFLLKKQRRDQALGLLARLKPPEREVLTLYYLKEMDQDEICGTLGIPKNRLRVQIFRALKKARALMEEDGQDRQTFE